MAKCFALCLFPLLSFLPMHPAKDDTIAWSATRRLVWSDFRARPDAYAYNAALTSSEIVFGFHYNSAEGFTWNIQCLFNKDRSWVRVKNNYILAHEQGHFDITEIYARKLQQQLKGYRLNKDRVSKDVSAIYQQVMKEQNDTQNRYDTETDNSIKKGPQERWLEKIKDDLERLKAYADYK